MKSVWKSFLQSSLGARIICQHPVPLLGVRGIHPNPRRHIFPDSRCRVWDRFVDKFDPILISCPSVWPNFFHETPTFATNNNALLIMYNLINQQLQSGLPYLLWVFGFINFIKWVKGLVITVLALSGITSTVPSNSIPNACDSIAYNVQLSQR